MAAKTQKAPMDTTPIVKVRSATARQNETDPDPTPLRNAMYIAEAVKDVWNKNHQGFGFH